ncbi:tripartite motif-containing protein 16-like [Labeo rohita]|uniref:tripartite motif-containing protein 16-like n=1 Tax=Labeo rohita TaxID=84645 RepID=UPI0021E33C97|nr:tripartite motif-containing protein 16-like [Labeo rohita]
MAEASVFSVDQFSCPVCLDLLKDPVAIPCGHSYCMSCITDCWDQDDQKRVYSCPQCRKTFSPRPALYKNTILTEVVEKLKKTKLKAAVPAGSGDVECDICTGRKHKAVKFCLVCLESYCQTHFERHEEFRSGKRHKVTDATGRLQQMICHQHDKLLEVFCRTDQQCVCVLCMTDEHKNHETVSTAAERTEKEKHLKKTQRKLQQRIQQRQKDLEQLREDVKSHKRSAQTAVEDSERIFTELIRSIERSRSEVTQRIRDQEKAAVSRAEGQMDRLEQEIDDLMRRNAELEQLSHTDDHIHFLQEPHVEFPKIWTRVLYGAEPLRKADSHQLALDPNTAYKLLRLSEGNTVVTYTNTRQPYPDHPDRFVRYLQVLCRESVSGRCYWEVEWSGREVQISLSYKSISRKGSGHKCLFGCNDQSWRLSCSPFSFSFWHKDKYTELPVPSSCSRIGVYVDHSAGTLSFYSVSDTMNLIHTVQTTFTQPLYPGFGVGYKSSAKLC